jgi:eukaryotic-like serine/threonine-protein kinase
MALQGANAPARLGRYELLARLATGGMGEIFLARLEGAAGFEKLVVVKRILPHLADDQRFRQMLIAEARVASKMSHSNICQVHELGETDGQLYIVMEYLEGVTLLPLLRKASKDARPLDYGFVGGVIQQTCDALHYAHELRDRNGEYLGIVHRDVTPSNVFLTDSGITKVLDFGIAKVKDASANTQTGTVKGKYAYMAPEQLRGSNIDRRVDVFALGVSLYEMLALRRLFQRATDYLTFRAVMEQPIPDIRRYRPDAPEPLVDAIMRALERDPANRYDTARQFGTAVLDALNAIKRPWSQGEISDFVRANFSNELGKRSRSVMAAVHRQTDSSVGRSTMPLIAHSDEPPEQLSEEDDEDDGFPSVETEVSEVPSAIRSAGRPTSSPADFGSQTPPPFATETTPSAAMIEPLKTGQGMPSLQQLHGGQLVMAQRRSIVWPLLATAMVGIAAAALYLVWKQGQERNQPAPQQVVVVGTTTIDAGTAVAPDPTDAAVAVIAQPHIDGGVAVVPPPHPPHPPPAGKEPKAILSAALPSLDKCRAAHGDENASLPDKFGVQIHVGEAGRVSGVDFEPSAIGKLGTGTCMRGVLLAIGPFPTVPAGATLNININVPR